MLLPILKTLFTRDLTKLKSEIELYRNEKIIWQTEKNISNSAGNLCLHLIGNLNTFIGAALGHTNYMRNRELEFSLKNISREALLSNIEQTMVMVNITLDNLREEEITGEYPLLVFKEKTSIQFFLVHLATHLSYHLGQINYHRRLMDA